MVDRNDRRRIVFPSRSRALREAGGLYSRLFCQRFQFTVAGMLLASAGRRMVRHQQFHQHVPSRLHTLGRRLDGHPRLALPDARSRIHALPHVHHANAANAHRSFILLMAQRGDGNSLHASRIENCGSGRHRDALPIDRQLHTGRCLCAHRRPPVKQTPAAPDNLKQLLRFRAQSIRYRDCKTSFHRSQK